MPKMLARASNVIHLPPASQRQASALAVAELAGWLQGLEKMGKMEK